MARMVRSVMANWEEVPEEKILERGVGQARVGVGSLCW